MLQEIQNIVDFIMVHDAAGNYVLHGFATDTG